MMCHRARAFAPETLRARASSISMRPMSALALVVWLAGCSSSSSSPAQAKDGGYVEDSSGGLIDSGAAILDSGMPPDTGAPLVDASSEASAEAGAPKYPAFP